MELKICTKCSLPKPTSEFYHKNNSPQQPCKLCKIEAVRSVQDEYYNEVVKARNRERAAAKRELRKEISEKTKFAANLVAGLRKRGRKETGKRIEVDIAVNKDFVMTLAAEQGFKCYYSGLRMVVGDNFKAPSLDRVDSAKGYTKDNVVLCCRAINYAKSEFSEESLREFLLELKLVNN